MENKFLNQIIHLVEIKLGLKPHLFSLLIWKDRIRERMVACQLLTYEKYVTLLQSSSQEMQELIELIVNPETWFFREKGAFDYLMLVVKQMKTKFPCLNILSLACSTGEEPYSIAMTLLDAGISKNAFKIDAWDINRKALEIARMGIYHQKSFRSKELEFKNRYFNLTSLGYIIKNVVKHQVTFSEVNLLESSHFFNFSNYQIVFCRNFLIYLHKNAQIGLLNQIKEILDPQGILIVSAAETDIVCKSGFNPILCPGSNAFKLK